MSRLLIDEPPLQVLPTLAQYIGLNEALVIQQIHYWINNPKIGRVCDNRRWVRNSLLDWKKENFKFWSESTIKRILKSLESSRLIIRRDDLNDSSYDHTDWYTINYDDFEEVCRQAQFELIEEVQSELIVEPNLIPSIHRLNIDSSKTNTPKPSTVRAGYPSSTPLGDTPKLAKTTPEPGTRPDITPLESCLIDTLHKFGLKKTSRRLSVTHCMWLNRVVLVNGITYPSPETLYNTDPTFRIWITKRCEYWLSDGNKDKNEQHLIRLCCAFDGIFGWNAFVDLRSNSQESQQAPFDYGAAIQQVSAPDTDREPEENSDENS